MWSPTFQQCNTYRVSQKKFIIEFFEVRQLWAHGRRPRVREKYEVVTVNLSVHLPTFGVAARKEHSLQVLTILMQPSWFCVLDIMSIDNSIYLGWYKATFSDEQKRTQIEYWPVRNLKPGGPALVLFFMFAFFYMCLIFYFCLFLYFSDFFSYLQLNEKEHIEYRPFGNLRPGGPALVLMQS